MLRLAILVLLPVLATSSSDVSGNIHLLEEEVATAIKSCTGDGNRQRRSDEYGNEDPYMDRTPRIDGNNRQHTNQYNHERRNTSQTRDQIHVLNATDYDYGGYGAGNAGERYVNSVPRPALGSNYNNETSARSVETGINRTRRSDPLVDKSNSAQVCGTNMDETIDPY